MVSDRDTLYKSCVVGGIHDPFSESPASLSLIKGVAE